MEFSRSRSIAVQRLGLGILARLPYSIARFSRRRHVAMLRPKAFSISAAARASGIALEYLPAG
jgi:hypothetical protein